MAVIGRGRMGGAFSRAFRAADVPCVLLAGRGDAPVRAGLDGAVTYLLAVTDRALDDVLARLVAQHALVPGDAVVHLAGMLGPDVLARARDHGAVVGALHPLVAVAVADDPPPLDGRVASFEGDPAALDAVREFAAPIGLRVVPMNDVDRARYHAAAALVATGAVALAQGAAALFAHAADTRDDPSAVASFARSLLESVAHNVTAAQPARALASPLVRGDTATLERHLAAMEIAPDARALYLAALAQVLGASEGLDPAVIERARAVLARG